MLRYKHDSELSITLDVHCDLNLTEFKINDDPLHIRLMIRKAFRFKQVLHVNHMSSCIGIYIDCFDVYQDIT